MSRDPLAHLFRRGERRPRLGFAVHYRDDVTKKGGEPTVARKQWTFEKGYKRRKPAAKASGGQKHVLVRKGEKPRTPDPNAKTFKIVKKGADPDRQARLDADLQKSRRASTEREPFVQRLSADEGRVEKGSGWSSHLFSDHGPTTVSLGYEVDEEEREHQAMRALAKRLGLR